MALFVMVGSNGPAAIAKRGAVRPRHLEHLKSLEREGHLALAGPLFAEDGTTPSGSLIVFEADDMAHARGIAEADPYVCDGVFASYALHPFTRVFPAEAE